MDEHFYRIAIASSDGINVDTHFGHAFSFIIADVNEHTGEVTEVGERDEPGLRGAQLRRPSGQEYG